jgi:hypothetical protein
MVHQDPPHHLEREAEEMRPVLPVGVSLVDESKVGLVDQGGRLQDVSLRLAPKSGRRPATPFEVDDRDEFVPRGEIASAPRVQESRHVGVGTAQVILRCRPSCPWESLQSRH